MNNSPKIVVIKLRELLYTLLLLFLAILLIICLVLMFMPGKKKADSPEAIAGQEQHSGQEQAAQKQPAASEPAQGQPASQPGQTVLQEQGAVTSVSSQTVSGSASYTPGIYTAPVVLGDYSAEVEVTLDADRIKSIRLVNLSETAAAAYPLVSPSLDHLAAQILQTQTLEGLSCPSENKYTSQLLLSAIGEAVSQARQP